MRTAKALLRRLTEKYPPPDRARHAIIVEDDAVHVVIALPGKHDHPNFQHLTRVFAL